jgi:hypothetical protein
VPILMEPSFLWMVVRRLIINMFQAKQASNFFISEIKNE